MDLLPLEEVRIGRYVYDLAGLGMAVEVVTSRLSEGRGLSLREKLEAFRGRGTWWFTLAGGEISYLRGSVLKYVDGVEAMDLFEAVRRFRDLV